VRYQYIRQPLERKMVGCLCIGNLISPSPQGSPTATARGQVGLMEWQVIKATFVIIVMMMVMRSEAPFKVNHEAFRKSLWPPQCSFFRMRGMQRRGHQHKRSLRIPNVRLQEADVEAGNRRSSHSATVRWLEGMQWMARPSEGHSSSGHLDRI